MIAPRSDGNRSDMSASSPSAAGVAPASTNRPAAARRGQRPREDRQRGPQVVDHQTGHDEERGSADDAVADDRRASERLEPIAPVEQAGAEDDARHDDRADGDLVDREAAHEDLVREPRVALGRAGRGTGCSHTPMAALMAIQVGASSHTCDVRMSVQVPIDPDVLAGDRLLRAAGSCNPNR